MQKGKKIFHQQSPALTGGAECSLLSAELRECSRNVCRNVGPDEQERKLIWFWALGYSFNFLLEWWETNCELCAPVERTDSQGIYVYSRIQMCSLQAAHLKSMHTYMLYNPLHPRQHTPESHSQIIAVIHIHISRRSYPSIICNRLLHIHKKRTHKLTHILTRSLISSLPSLFTHTFS